MDFFGLGKIGSAAVISGFVLVAGVGIYVYWEDIVGDRREAKIEKQALEERLKNVGDSKQRQILLERLPRFAKIWCSVDVPDRTCCAPDAVKLPRCTADPASALPRPD